MSSKRSTGRLGPCAMVGGPIQAAGQGAQQISSAEQPGLCCAGGVYMPQDNNKMSKGFAFVEFASPAVSSSSSAAPAQLQAAASGLLCGRDMQTHGHLAATTLLQHGPQVCLHLTCSAHPVRVLAAASAVQQGCLGQLAAAVAAYGCMCTLVPGCSAVGGPHPAVSSTA